MKEYIFRHNNPTKFEYFTMYLKRDLGETYGIMVYQEDVIKIALHFAGLAAADSDVLRRAMSGKGHSLSTLKKVKDHFFKSCKELGHLEQLSKEVHRQIESFAGYSFCKAHTASYAVKSYQSLFLKVYCPIEFMVCAINNGGGFYRTEVYVHEAKMSGAMINNPRVNLSECHTKVYGTDVYLIRSRSKCSPTLFPENMFQPKEEPYSLASGSMQMGNILIRHTSQIVLKNIRFKAEDVIFYWERRK